MLVVVRLPLELLLEELELELLLGREVEPFEPLEPELFEPELLEPELLEPL